MLKECILVELFNIKEVSVKYLALILLVLYGGVLSAEDNSVVDECIINKGVIAGDAPFSSDQQVIALQDLMKAKPDCPRYAILWKINLEHISLSKFLLHDNGKRPHLARIKITKGIDIDMNDISYINWMPSTRESILADDPSDGFDQPNMKTGQGKPLMPSAESKFVSEYILPLFDQQ